MHTEKQQAVLGDLVPSLWKLNPKLAANPVVRLRFVDASIESGHCRLRVDVSTGTWPVWFHPYSILVYLEEPC